MEVYQKNSSRDRDQAQVMSEEEIVKLSTPKERVPGIELGTRVNELTIHLKSTPTLYEEEINTAHGYHLCPQSKEYLFTVLSI